MTLIQKKHDPKVIEKILQTKKKRIFYPNTRKKK